MVIEQSRQCVVPRCYLLTPHDTLRWILPRGGVPTGGVLAVTCFGLKINELPSCIAKDIFKAPFVDDLAICFRGRTLDTIERHLQQAVNAIQEWATRNGFRTLSGHHRETSTAGSEFHTGMGDKEWFQVCSPQVQSRTFHCIPVSGSETPHCEDWKHTSASGGVHEVPWALVGLAPLIQETHQCAEDTV